MRNLILMLCLTSWGARAADVYTFSLLPPNGAVQGAAGATVGWGYTLQNQSSSLWLVPTDLNSGTFDNGTPTSLFDFPVLAPGGTATKAFDSASGVGLFQLTWNATAPVGAADSGVFDLSAQWWSGDPIGGGALVSDAPAVHASYLASVSTADVPEPSSFGLTMVVLLLGCPVAVLAGRKITDNCDRAG